MFPSADSSDFPSFSNLHQAIVCERPGQASGVRAALLLWLARLVIALPGQSLRAPASFGALFLFAFQCRGAAIIIIIIMSMPHHQPPASTDHCTSSILGGGPPARRAEQQCKPATLSAERSSRQFDQFEATHRTTTHSS